MSASGLPFLWRDRDEGLARAAARKEDAGGPVGPISKYASGGSYGELMIGFGEVCGGHKEAPLLPSRPAIGRSRRISRRPTAGLLSMCPAFSSAI